MQEAMVWYGWPSNDPKEVQILILGIWENIT